MYRTRRETCPYFKLLSWNPITTITLAFRWAFSSNPLAQITSWAVIIVVTIENRCFTTQTKVCRGNNSGKALRRVLWWSSENTSFAQVGWNRYNVWPDYHSPQPGGRDLIDPLRTVKCKKYHETKSAVKTQVTHGTVISSSFFPKPDSWVSGDLAMRLCGGVTVSF